MKSPTQDIVVNICVYRELQEGAYLSKSSQTAQVGFPLDTLSHDLPVKLYRGSAEYELMIGLSENACFCSAHKIAVSSTPYYSMWLVDNTATDFNCKCAYRCLIFSFRHSSCYCFQPTSATAYVNGVALHTLNGVPHTLGFVALGGDSFGLAYFDDLLVK